MYGARVGGSGVGSAKSTSWRRRLSAVGVAVGVLAVLATAGMPNSQPAHVHADSRTRIIFTAANFPRQSVPSTASTGLSSPISRPSTGWSPTSLLRLRSLSLISRARPVSPDVTGDMMGTAALGTRAPAAVFPVTTGATRLAAAGDDGAGVTVAVLDTGIDKNSDFAGRLVGGVDLSGEGNPFQDSYGHGTFVAGLIAGDGASSGGKYAGEAPGASLVSVKVAGATGSTDLATVLNGIQWTITNQARFHIRVLNLSLGVLPDGTTATNPLDRAVEAAWHAGIAVVVSTGNDGPTKGSILSPGDDPLVITAGAFDDNGTSAPGDDIRRDVQQCWSHIA